jgi:heme/copper-type cytochrome/quinol oxidase subunit 2
MMSSFANAMAKLALLIIELFLMGGAAIAFYMKKNGNLTDSTKHAYMAWGIVFVVIWVVFNMLLCCFWK